jgi:hypothetical protein
MVVIDREIRKELRHVEGVLDEIRDNTALPWWRAILNGLLYGAGVVIGTILAIALLGWFLSLFGIIPGFDQISAHLQEIMKSHQL